MKRGFIKTDKPLHDRLNKTLNDGREAIRVISIHSKLINRCFVHGHLDDVSDTRLKYLAADNCVRLSQRCIVKGTKNLHEKFFRKCLVYIDQHKGGACSCTDHGVNLDIPVPYVQRLQHRMHDAGPSGQNSHVTRTSGHIYYSEGTYPDGIYRLPPNAGQKEAAGNHLYDARVDIEYENERDIPWP
jgi:hypothetical protein